MPPVHHLDSVVRNAQLFEAKWGYRTMGHWLHAFRLMGLIDDAPGAPIRILRRPDADDLALTGQQSHQPYSNTTSVIRLLEARAARAAHAAAEDRAAGASCGSRSPNRSWAAWRRIAGTWRPGWSARGHEVVLFASGDSDPRFASTRCCPSITSAPSLGRASRQPPLIAHVDAGYAAACDRIAAGGFDVVHNNSLHRLPAAARRRADRCRPSPRCTCRRSTRCTGS